MKRYFRLPVLIMAILLMAGCSPKMMDRVQNLNGIVSFQPPIQSPEPHTVMMKLESNLKITSLFGWRIHPITNEPEFHAGIDIAKAYGEPVFSYMDGIVEWSAQNKGFGLTVIVKNPKDNSHTLYGHCSKLLVKARDKVRMGQIIAFAGSTGISTGPHLHLGYWKKNRYIDPLQLLDQLGINWSLVFGHNFE